MLLAFVRLLGGRDRRECCVASAAAPTVRDAVASSTVAVEGAVGGSVSAGGNHTCAVSSDGAVACWGLNKADAVTSAFTITPSGRTDADPQ
jgi:hypothetical protein